MIQIINSSRVIPAAGFPPKQIEEYIGRVVSGTTGVSIAKMISPNGWSEPWQSPDFDEYTIVLNGTLHIETDEGSIQITDGMSVIVPKGTRIKYSTPDGAEYLAVCIPAFSSDIVNRLEDEQEISSSQDLNSEKYSINSYGPEGIELIEDNWNLLRKHIINKNPEFADKIKKIKFVDRKMELIKKNYDRKMKVHIATETKSGVNLGYCLSSAVSGDYGEVESIFVREEARKRGVGTALMKKGLEWIKNEGPTNVIVQVTTGNEDVLRFYKGFGLIPRQYILSNPGDI